MQNEQITITAAAVAAAFNAAEQGKALVTATRNAVKADGDNAVSALKALIADYQGDKPAFMLPDTVARVCANVEAEFIGAQPNAYKVVKNAITAYVREGFVDLSLGRDAMRKAAKAAEEDRLHGAEKARQEQVNAYLAEQEAARLAAQEAEAAAAAAEKEAAAAEDAARVAILWKNLQDACQSKAAQAAFAELTAALVVSL